MTTKDRHAEDREALTQLLEVYGADRTRWPARERLRFAGLVCEDREAHSLVAEAAALDRLLDLAPKASENRERALADRIVATAVAARRPSRRPFLAGRFAGSEWPAAGLLAASLVLGVFVGSTGTLDPTVQEVAEVAGIATESDDFQLALGDEVALWTGDDLL